MPSSTNAKDAVFPLKVLIVGAGIGGLAAAIALRQQGHDVEMFERSRFANEIGAAIHLTPNATGLLRKIGVNPRDYGAVLTEQIRDYTSDGELKFTGNITQFADTWQHEWFLIHRAHLHQALKDKAGADGRGRPVVLHTSSQVASVDPSSATVTLENGQSFTGDVVIGADGVHSAARHAILDRDVKTFSSGKNAFRFMVSRQEVLNDPETACIAKDLGSVDMWHSADSKVVIYPCVNNETLNFVCIHPDNLTNIGVANGWDQAVGKETLLDVYNHFEDRVRKVLNKAQADTLKIWPLLDMETLPTWVNDRLAIMGDAAHPFLPYRASGGAMAIEDGISLAIMLSGGVKKEEIPERLKLYEKARHERVTIIQEFTRESGRRHLPMQEAMSIMSYIYDYDEWDNSTELLRRHVWAQNPHVYYRQPTAFGPMPGPRQDFRGHSRAAASANATFRTASIRFKTSRTLLKNLLPNNSYNFLGNGSIAQATLSQTTLDGLDWLAGGGYNHLGLYIHGVQYTNADGQVTEGSYLPVLFEDLADPIISGREELGFPKLFSTIDIQKRDESYHVTAAWRGATWARLTLTGLCEAAPVAPSDTSRLLVHRYMPCVGSELKGTPEAEYAVFVDSAKEAEANPPKVKHVFKAKSASLEIDGLDWSQLPTLHHIVSRLAEVPVYEVVDARLVEGEGVMDISSARRI
ncbi:3-hydroxybenzoate 6-hydroxylase 1 [Aspergillus awamori]|uniref:3-hydroxybenzoate 6-hydroxylase 1 n=1 Tax=Aspergillus awamori TaxID=105351 RepID=A0A401L7I2_ASPAW|nr:3-hydroxybenzoate 6-hydroxylase 1 [Aspergillus awamori]GKZ62090.1 hypothetical protein AnigIFM49718_009160 [Aspergillus niger]GLA08896.1 hypothetical protein AnigIFM60653_010695 [Aspergillus niger]